MKIHLNFNQNPALILGSITLFYNPFKIQEPLDSFILTFVINQRL
jgi:hypothetical protein